MSTAAGKTKPHIYSLDSNGKLPGSVSDVHFVHGNLLERPLVDNSDVRHYRVRLRQWSKT